MRGFESARKLEKLELDIMVAVRKCSPQTVRAFPVAFQQWGAGCLDVNGIYATNRGEFFFVDFGQDAALTVRALETRKALDLLKLLGYMGVVGNRSSLSDLVYGEVPAAQAPPLLPKPPEKPK